MKSINFIDPVPPQKHRELTYWFYGSIITLLVLVSSMLIIHYNKLRTCRATLQKFSEMQEQVTQYQNLSSKKNELLKDKQQLEQQLRSLGVMRQSSGAAHRLLTKLSQAIPSTVCLTSVNGELNGRLTIKGEAHDAKAAVTFLELLNACPCLQDMQLNSISEERDKKSSFVAFTCVGLWREQKEQSEI